MAERSIIDQLDDAVTALLAKGEPVVNEADRELAELVAVARELQGLPSEAFRATLKEQLGGKEDMSTAAKQIESTPQPSQTIIPYLCYRDARSEEHASELLSPCNIVCRPMRGQEIDN